MPIEAIARALDIVSIEVAPLTGIEGCLQCDPLKSEGQIVVNANSPPRRRRYTIAHELGHFLNERHRPTIDFGFACTAEDLAKPRRTGAHQQQETEANTFAIEVLTPRSALGKFLKPPPSSTTRSHLRQRSRSAARRRSGATSHCRASASRRCSPRTAASATSRRARTSRQRRCGPAMRWATCCRDRPSGTLTTLDEADAFRWLKWPDGVTLFAQTLYQADGFAVTLLVAERDQSD